MTPPENWSYRLGDRVTKIKGSNWTGLVVGFYSTSLTPEGYAVESETESGSVQIYPVGALEEKQGPTTSQRKTSPPTSATACWQTQRSCGSLCRTAIHAFRLSETATCMRSAWSTTVPPMSLYDTFRRNLESAIAAHPSTFVSICTKAGYDCGYVRKVLTSKKVNPTLLFVECMAGALDLDPLDLLGERR